MTPTFDPEAFDLRRSPVFALTDDQTTRLRARFESERGLYFGQPPTFDGLLASLARLRAALEENYSVRNVGWQRP